jgi:predicted RNase H-like HicB family nuclease
VNHAVQWVDVTEADERTARRYALVIEWSQEDDTFVVSVPDLPGVHTHGAIREKAATMGNEVVALCIAAARSRNESLSPPAFSVLRPNSSLEKGMSRTDEEFYRHGVTPEELAEARRYPMTIEWSPEADLFLVRFPDAPGVHTHGATRAEAAERGEEAIVTWLTALRDAGHPLPPSPVAQDVA